MPHANPMKFRGFTLEAITREKPDGDWTASLHISDNGSRVYDADNVSTFKSPAEAEQNALEIATMIASGKVRHSGKSFRPRLTEDEYLLELNKRLRSHEGYEQGMEFITSPHGTTGSEVNGWDVLPPGGPSHVHILVATSMLTDFEVFASQRASRLG